MRDADRICTVFRISVSFIHCEFKYLHPLIRNF
jgi:hypothetical protein